MCGHLRFLSRSAAIVSALLLTMPGALHAQAVVSDDAHVSSAPKSVDTNFGTNPNLVVSATSTVFLKFQPGLVLPNGTPGSSVERATLQIYLGSVSAPGTLGVYAIVDPWTETTITSSTAPPLGPLIATTERITVDYRQKFLTIDITALVRQWLGTDGDGLGGVPNHGVAIAPVAAVSEIANVTFDSKENAQTSHEPRLNIQLSTTGEEGGGVTNVTADAPLSVTNGSTIPHITLGIVPAALGGTGLSSPGTAGNVLRSAGGTWTSAPLSSDDIPTDLGSYIRNTTVQQPSASFNISGSGAASVFDALTQFNISGLRVLTATGGPSLPYSNVFAGVNAGASTTPTTLFDGNLNAFFGFNSGQFNSTGCCNSFFGNYSGWSNTTGRSNAFVGGSAGTSNTTGSFNTFLGDLAAIGSTVGDQNTVVGYFAAQGLFNGSNNTSLGALTAMSGNLHFATVIGAGAVVTASNTVVLGRAVDTVQVPGGLTVAGLASANVVNATTQFNLGGSRVLSQPGTENFFGGRNAGAANTTGSANTFFGFLAGQFNTSGSGNSFFGRTAGRQTTTGILNSFFGSSAGASNTTGFGNSYVGGNAGAANTVGSSNSFLGIQAGNLNTEGGNNTFIGAFAGDSNTVGNSITLLGGNTDVATPGLDHATAIGADVVVSSSNTIVLGRSVDTVKIPGTAEVSGVRVAAPGQGMLLRSPNGATCRKLTIDDAGQLVLSVVACPQ